MKTFEVSYDLIKRKDYPELWKALNAFPSHLHLLGSSWLIQSNESANNICVALLKHIDGDDKLIVSELTQKGSTWTMSFPEAARNWLHAALD